MTTVVGNRYLGDSVTTAPPGQLLTMLYDRLCLDLQRAEKAVRTPDRAGVIEHVRHALDIVLELRGTLDVDAWAGGPGLAALYEYLVGELLRAQLQLDADRLAACRTLVEPLRDAWRQIAGAPACVDATTQPAVAPRAGGGWVG